MCCWSRPWPIRWLAAWASSGCPLAPCELAESPPRFLERLFAGGFKARQVERLGRALAERIEAGGFPPAFARSTPRRRQAWYRDGVVLYDGETCAPFGEGMYAVPIRALWETS